jgi:hypothetical protein
MVHGLFRASGIVMIYRLHHDPSEGRSAVSSECLGHFCRAEAGQFWKAPKWNDSTGHSERSEGSESGTGEGPGTKAASAQADQSEWIIKAGLNWKTPNFSALY